VQDGVAALKGATFKAGQQAHTLEGLQGRAAPLKEGVQDLR